MKKEYYYITILGVLFLVSIGLSYAWFSDQFSGSGKDMTVQTGTLELLFQDGPEIEGKYVNPAWTESKIFKVTNTGTLDTYYTVWWTDFENTIEKDELVYSLKCTSYSDYDKNVEASSCPGFSEKVMNTADDLRILSNVSIPSGYTHEYEITLLFKEMGSNQNYNQGKLFNGTINIKEYYENETELPVIETYNTENYVLTARVSDTLGLQSYAITYPTADLIPEDIEWISLKNEKVIDLEVKLNDYKAIFWLKNRAGNIAYVDLTPRNKLTVDVNGGTWNGNVSEQIYNLEYQETKEISNPTREGYTFNGWDIVSEGSESSLINNIFTMGENDTTLKAEWKINKYNLIVNPNGGSYNNSTNETTYEMEYNSTQNIANPTRTGYTFTGWTKSSDKADLSTNVLTIGSEDCTLTAKWTINTYPWIAYHNQMNVNGEGYTRVDADTQSGNLNYGTKVTPSVKVYTGFKTPTAIELTISEVEANNVVNYNYERQKYNLTINPNGGSYNSSTSNTIVSVYYGQNITLSTPVRTGYNFNNWTKSGGGTLNDNVFTGGTSVSTITANWSAIQSKVTFNANGGGTPSKTSIDVKYGEEYGELATISRDGYIFNGWFTAASGGTEVTATTVVKITSAQTLYAHWTLNSPVVAYSCSNGSTGSTKLLTYTGECEVIKDSDTNWRVKLLSSGTLTVSKAMTIDAFLVGGGGAGCRGVSGTGGGGGGSGGNVLTKKGISLSTTASYSITIGAGGTATASVSYDEENMVGKSTTGFGATATGGNYGGWHNSKNYGITHGGDGGGSGGGGGGGTSVSKANRAGGKFGGNGISSSLGGVGKGSTTCEFGEGTTSSCTNGNDYAYAGGGGGGGYCSSSAAGSDYCYGGDGGIGGGGNGGYSRYYKDSSGDTTLTTGRAGTDGRGGGGGGGSAYSSDRYAGGDGGDGVIVIRNAR